MSCPYCGTGISIGQLLRRPLRSKPATPAIPNDARDPGHQGMVRIPGGTFWMGSDDARVVCGWNCNTDRLARRHYLRITEADFDLAIGTRAGLQRAAKGAAISSSEYAQLAPAETNEPRFDAENALNAVPQGSSIAQDEQKTRAVCAGLFLLLLFEHHV
jgi:hypothetical protein